MVLRPDLTTLSKISQSSPELMYRKHKYLRESNGANPKPVVNKLLRKI